MNTCKWAVRHMDREAIEKLHQVQQTSGGLLGELVSEAIDDWFNHLPEETEDEASIALTEAADTPIHQVRQDIAHLRNEAASRLRWNGKS
jgi:hypothetical protein